MLEKLTCDGSAEKASATILQVKYKMLDFSKTLLNFNQAEYIKRLSQVLPSPNRILLLVLWGNWKHIQLQCAFNLLFGHTECCSPMGTDYSVLEGSTN